MLLGLIVDMRMRLDGERYLDHCLVYGRMDGHVGS